ncbi:GDP-D-glucose phosphorylase 1-like isoform X2 [Xenia sp. Carnegie-2017]|uniref:GDP-D-glucose phosphorylase 1-like isoform X2 n=1 Tax=Xenia sp. Carnegie-2017 TaxID=2897299 RepID=UPI001F033B92|nr:GDP-D-glucose phosphorylase 1-like isoform X2 [Xenia sp. Carnegie-2017]
MTLFQKMAEDCTKEIFVLSCEENDYHFQSLNAFTKFDNELLSRWDHAMLLGCFKYNLESVERRIISGKYNFVAQFNKKRFTQRRPPQNISSLNQPYNADQFNFTKIPEKEILFTLSSNKNEDSRERNIVVINISPLEYGNVLLVPNVDGQLPQVLTEKAIHLAMETVFLSGKRDFRLGFNSLCGFASVNHQHFHGFYTHHTLPVETVSVSSLCDGVYETVDFPITTFAFEVYDHQSMTAAASRINKVTSYLYENEIAHNVFLTRGLPLSLKKMDGNKKEVLRIFVWARKNSTGIKNENMFNMAVCELAGFLPIKERSWYDNMTEEDVCEKFKTAALESRHYDQIRKDIILLLQP